MQRKTIPEPEGDEESGTVEALRAGDERLFHDLVRSLHPKLLALALRVVPREELAEEVVQETWIAVVRGLTRFRCCSRLETWIVAILLRRAQTCAAHERRSLAADRPRWATRAVTARTPQDELLGREERRRCSAAIRRLPERQRHVFTLRAVVEQGPAEVTTRLGLSPGHQRVLLHRARKRLAGLLGEGER